MSTHIEAETFFENELPASVLNLIQTSVNLLNVTVTDCRELSNTDFWLYRSKGYKLTKITPQITPMLLMQ